LYSSGDDDDDDDDGDYEDVVDDVSICWVIDQLMPYDHAHG
jgi:hypothetical protein